jgi:hypothetical protein
VEIVSRWPPTRCPQLCIYLQLLQGWAGLVDLLVRDLKTQVDAQDGYLFTPLHAAANGGHVTTIQRLIQYQHDVDMRDYLGGLLVCSCVDAKANC